jgi:ATP-dependent Clp protease ATP-binding subunit ClpB
MPLELDELRRKIMQVEIEREALKLEESSDANKREIDRVEAEIAGLQEKNRALTARWDDEKKDLTAVQELRSQIEQRKTELEQAQRMGDLERAARIQYGELLDLGKKLDAAETKIDQRRAKGDVLIKEEVDPEAVAQIVAKWTGIPVSRLVESERRS